MALLKIVSLKTSHKKKIEYSSSPFSPFSLILRALVFFLILDFILSKNSDSSGQCNVKPKSEDSARKDEVRERLKFYEFENTLNANFFYDNQWIPIIQNGGVDFFTLTFSLRGLGIDLVQEVYEKYPGVFKGEDIGKESFSYSLASSAIKFGNIEVLNWIVNTDLDLFNVSPFRIESEVMLATFADKTDNEPLMKWLYDNKQVLFRLATNAVSNPYFFYFQGLNIFNLLYKVNPQMLMERDNNGYTLATLAARLGNTEGLRTLYKLVPETFNQVDDHFMDPLTSALLNGQMRAYIEIMEFKPISLLLHVITAGAAICLAFDVFVAQLRDRKTLVNVHDGSRDSKTFNAFQTLKEHIGKLEANYFWNVFLSDLGLKEMEMSIKTLEELSSNQESYKDKSLYLVCYLSGNKFRSQEIVLNEIQHDKNQSQLTFNIVPENGYPVETERSLIRIDNKGEIFDKTKNVSIKQAVIYVPIEHSNSSLSNSFKNDLLFRFALGFTTISGNPLFFPQLFNQFYLVPYKSKVVGREVLMYAHAFVNIAQDSNEQRLREAAFINGIKDGVTLSNYGPNKWYRFCEKGQAQYLLITLLQGRLPGVMIDDTTMEGLKNVIPSVNELVTECCLNAQKQRADNQETFMAFVKNDYTRNNPFLSGNEYPDLKEKFWSEIKTYARYLDPAEPLSNDSKKES